jgi:hypothetical protein
MPCACLVDGPTALAAHIQDLATTGSKQWGSWWDGRGLLRVKIYDFAIYANARQVAAVVRGAGAGIDSAGATFPAAGTPESSSDGAGASDPVPESRRPLRALRVLRPLRGRRRGSGRGASLAACVRGNSDDGRVEMCLLVRPARDLPLLLLRSEYKRILQKRIKALGGDPSDAALLRMLQLFNADALPPASTRRGCFRKGSTLQLCRSRSGRLTAAVDGSRLATVESRALCAAVFDLYLGDQPVCRQAQARANATLHQMGSQPLLMQV